MGTAKPFDMSQNPLELSVTKHKTSVGANTRVKPVNVPKNLNDLAYGETQQKLIRHQMLNPHLYKRGPTKYQTT